MCCFSGKMKNVSDTKIFAKSDRNGLEYVVYEMSFKAADDVAMILPIPMVADPGEKAVRFINLLKYPKFFQDLTSGFPALKSPNQGRGGMAFGGIAEKPKLKVVDVGDFDASFVPTVGDFSRLDERFRLPESTWTEVVPRYSDYGFAVFKLKSDSRLSHPLAFSFPRRHPEELFFPTMHIHDGEAHERATFDHILYCQLFEGEFRNATDWEESEQPAELFMKIERVPTLLHASAHVYRKVVRGERKNEDIVL